MWKESEIMIYGYVRISTAKQSIERQIRNIKEAYPQAVILQEVYTGTKSNRKQWNKLFSGVKDGDTIIFDSVSRMSRNAEEGFAAYENLYHRNVRLVFLKEPLINTDTYRKTLENQIALTGTIVDYILEGINKYLMALAREQIRLAFQQAEKEIQDIGQRTKEGLAIARLEGKQFGHCRGTKLTTKKSIASKKVILKHAKAFGGTLQDLEVIKLLGISRTTYYKYKRELKSQEIMSG